MKLFLKNVEKLSLDTSFFLKDLKTSGVEKFTGVFIVLFASIAITLLLFIYLIVDLFMMWWNKPKTEKNHIMQKEHEIAMD